MTTTRKITPVKRHIFNIIALAWKRGIRLGYHATSGGLLRGRVMLLNALAIVTAFSIVLFSGVYAFIGYQYFYGPLYIIPVAVSVLMLNNKGKFVTAQNVYLVGSLIVMSYWCYEGRGNGNEYTLMALATTATLISEKRNTAILINFLCASIFVAYKFYDLNTPFVPDPAINYKIIPTIIVLNTVGIISFQIAFFRDLAKHYNQKLSIKYSELRVAEEELKSNNEEIKAMNEKLFGSTAELESMIRQKTLELQTYINAIDVNLYSCITDLEGIFVQVNDQLVKASGYSRDELIGKHYSLLATPAHQQIHFLERREKLYEGHVWRGEVEHKSKSGSYYWFDCVVIPIRDETGQNKCFLSIGLPITERKLHEQLREKTYGILESIAFRASHEIRGPMARIKGLANLMETGALDIDELKIIAGKFSICCDELSFATSELVAYVHDHQKLLFKSGAQ